MTIRERYGFSNTEPTNYTPEEVLAEIDVDVKANRRLMKLYLDAMERVSKLEEENKMLKNNSSNDYSTLAKILTVVENQATVMDILVNGMSNVEDNIVEIKSTINKIDDNIGDKPSYNTTIFSAIEELKSWF